jgi:hypothetical protein
MRDITKLSNRAKIERAWMTNNSVMIHEPKSTLEATNRVVKILDATYEKADLNALVTEKCKHLSVPDQEKLLKLLTDVEDLFDGSLGDCETEPVSLKLKEGTKPSHDMPFQTPKAHKETLKKEAQRLCELGILKCQTDFD